MMMIDGRYCRGVARAYHAAFLQVERYINVEFIISYYERFGFLSVSTPEEKAEWIRAFTMNIDRDVIDYRTHDFFQSMKDLLMFHSLVLKYDFETKIFTCEYGIWNY
jgi:hypothetical protein